MLQHILSYIMGCKRNRKTLELLRWDWYLTSRDHLQQVNSVTPILCTRTSAKIPKYQQSIIRTTYKTRVGAAICFHYHPLPVILAVHTHTHIHTQSVMLLDNSICYHIIVIYNHKHTGLQLKQLHFVTLFMADKWEVLHIHTKIKKVNIRAIKIVCDDGISYDPYG